MSNKMPTVTRTRAADPKDQAAADFLDRMVTSWSRRFRELEEGPDTWLSPPFLSVVLDELPSGELKRRIVPTASLLYG